KISAVRGAIFRSREDRIEGMAVLFYAPVGARHASPSPVRTANPTIQAMAGEAWTVRRLLEWTTPFFLRKEVDSPRLSAELLLAHVLKVPRIKLYTDYERVLGEEDLTQYRALVQRAAEHEPIAYLTGLAHFFNLEFE